jgi:Cys-tRNA(Pro)/Cys-tRNA(Cys) deacylase
MASLGQQELDRRGVRYTSHEYDYRIQGSEAAALALGLPLVTMVKTLVVRLSDDSHVLLLASGSTVVSMRGFARALGVKGADLASERDAERLTGYRVGGIGPFGTRNRLRTYTDLRLLDHERVYVNGGRRGLLLGLSPEALIEAAEAELLDVSRPG